MATTTIPWGDGSGDNIYLTYTSASGNQTVQVSSDPNDGPARTKDITFVSAVGNIARVLTVMQETNMDYVSITWNDTCITFNDTGIAYPYEEEYIVFADPYVEAICVANWGDGTGIKPSQAAQVTSLEGLFDSNTDIVSFDELRYFTGLKQGSVMGYLIRTANTFSVALNLEYITLPETTTRLGDRYFNAVNANVKALKRVTFLNTNGPIQFGQYTVYNNTSFPNFNAVVIKDLNNWLNNVYHSSQYSNPTVAAHHLYVDNAEVTSVVFPQDMTEIPICCLTGLSSITSITLPSNVTGIGDYAFYDCSGISGTLQLPSSLTSIGSNAFWGCSGLTGRVEIPSTVTSIGASAFRACSGITDFIFNPTIQLKSSCVNGSGNSTGEFYAAGDVLTDYARAIQGFIKIQIDGDVIHDSNRALGTSPEIRIGGSVRENNSYAGHIVKSGGPKLKFMEIGGTVTLSQGRLINNNSELDATESVLHLKYNGIACTPTVACASYTRLTKIYVDSQSVLDQYLADSDWSAYSSKLDLWANYNGEYKN